MFDKLKAMGAVAALMKDKDKLRAAAERVKERLAQTRVEGAAGLGAVRVTATGSLKILAVELQPALAAGMAADDRTRELAGSLIADAVNDALAKAQHAMREIVSREAREMGLPEIPPEMSGLMG